MRIALLGGNGMLGRDLAPVLVAAGVHAHVYDLPDWDITVAADRQAALADVDAVINCAAYTAVDRAESEPALAAAVNGDAPAALAQLAAASGCYLLHISTDFVFDGRGSDPYREDDEPRPRNVYGRTKLAGEQAVLAHCPAACVVRLQWTYGAHGQNFITKIRARARESGRLRVVDDQVGAPTPTARVAEVLGELTRRRVAGLFHYAAAGYASRYEVAARIVENLDIDVDLQRCRSADFATPAARPLSSRFDCSRIDAVLGLRRRPWQKELDDFLEQCS